MSSPAGLRLLLHKENGSYAHKSPPGNAGRLPGDSKRHTPERFREKKLAGLSNAINMCAPEEAEKHTCVLPESMALST